MTQTHPYLNTLCIYSIGSTNSKKYEVDSLDTGAKEKV